MLCVRIECMVSFGTCLQGGCQGKEVLLLGLDFVPDAVDVGVVQAHVQALPAGVDRDDLFAAAAGHGDHVASAAAHAVHQAAQPPGMLQLVQLVCAAQHQLQHMQTALSLTEANDHQIFGGLCPMNNRTIRMQ